MTWSLMWMAVYCVVLQVAQAAQADYYDEYYGNEVFQGTRGKAFGYFVGDNNIVTSKSAIGEHYSTKNYGELGEVTTPATPKSIVVHRGKAFAATCERDAMLLTIKKSTLPKDLQLHAPKNLPPSCIKVQHLAESTTYEVALTCQRAIRNETSGSKQFLRHHALLKRKGSTVTKSNPYSVLYTIVIECEIFGDGNGAEPVQYRSKAEMQVYEHRVSSGGPENCERQRCPYGELCLSPDLVNGYYCVCNGFKCHYSCPDGYYGCRKSNTSDSMFDRLHCIDNGWLCDNRFDCKLEDDESPCVEVWSSWTAWSKCNGDCDDATQIRRRKCDVSFTVDPDRCKIHRNAPGCSRRCSINKQSETETRQCQLPTCSSVSCNNQQMTVVIPREPGMTPDAIRTRMLIGGDPTCKPSYNDTHVIFITSLNDCNTSSQVDHDSVTYHNEIVFRAPNGGSSIIMRDVGHSYAVNCRFNRRRTVVLRKRNQSGRNDQQEVAALAFDYKRSSLPLNDAAMEEHFASGDGEFDFKMDVYRDSTFSKPFRRNDYPLTKQLREEIFVGIQFDTDDESEDLTVVAEKCQATPNPLKNSELTYVFINEGCALDDTVKFYDLKKNMAAFSLEAFRFNNQSMHYVYFQCDVVVCDVDDEDPLCKRNCSKPNVSSRQKRWASDVADNEKIRGFVIQGPLIVEEPNEVMTEFEEQSEKGSVVHRRLFGDPGFLEGSPNVPTSNEYKVTLKTWHYVTGILGCSLVVLLIGFVAVLTYRKRPNPANV